MEHVLINNGDETSLQETQAQYLLEKGEIYLCHVCSTSEVLIYHTKES